MPSSPIESLRVGIVGAGYVSKYHLSALKTLDFVEIVGLADVDADLARQVARKFGVPFTCTSLAELASQRPNAIYILTPPATHLALTLEALDLGCHVLVEKPMAETAEDCDRMIERAREKGLVLSVNHSARLDPVVLQSLDRLRDGACGTPLEVDFFRSSQYEPYSGGPRPAMYRKGSYPFQDLGVHGLYLLEAYLGEIRKLDVDYRGTGLEPNLVFDEWRAFADCERGVGRMYISWNVRPMPNRIEIFGTGGILKVDCFMQTLIGSRNLPGPKFPQMVLSTAANGFKEAFVVMWNTVQFAFGRLKPSPGIYKGALDFATALHEGKAPPVSAEEGRRIAALMEDVCARADADADRRRAEALAPLAPCPVLVTGAAGFLGSALVKRLIADTNETIRVLVRRPTPFLQHNPRVQMVCGDLGDPEIVDHAVQGVERIFHVGAAMKGGPQQFQAGTVWGTKNIIDSSLRHGVKRLVYVSSVSVLDHAGHRPGTSVTEDAPLEPHPERRGSYTQTKLEAETLVRKAVKTHGLPAVILRPGQIFGPGAEGVAPPGIIGIGGRWIVVGDGGRRLPLVYVEDVVDALLSGADKDGIEGEVIHLVDPAPVTQRQYVAKAQEAGIAAAKPHYVPQSVMMALASGIEMLGRVVGRDVPVTRYRIRSIRPLADFDDKAARDKLGWSPRVGADAGLAATFPAGGASA